ncbi:MAG: alpha/beta hydrolase [Verrucomicrobiota bacterium]|nr:alpha/beta hydrolase [Limisphaerales bacterium]
MTLKQLTWQLVGVQRGLLLVSTFIALSLLALCGCRTPARTDAVASLCSKSVVVPNLTYLKVDGIDLQLDVYMPAKELGGAPWVKFSDERRPVLLYIHGGGWTDLNRAYRNLNFLPYVEKGWAVVNIDYRLLKQAPFPACIADCRHALNWIYENADGFKFDTSRIVVSGESAGGHLALMTGFLTNDAALAIPNHPINRELKVAAVINWFGISDVGRIMETWNSPSYVTNLVGDISKKEEIYRSCSPLTHVNPSVPPVLTIHGDADQVVPFIHATLLHDALDQCWVKNALHVVKGKKHGNFDETEMSENFRIIWKFLDEVGVNYPTKRK